jgi:hypothetical protein
MHTAFKAFTSIWTFACAVWVIAASEACAPPTKEGLDCGIDRGDATAESVGSEPSAGPAFAMLFCIMFACACSKFDRGLPFC